METSAREPFRHVFIATDFSPGAAQALSRAARLPMADRCKVTIAHVLSNRIPKPARAEADKIARQVLDQETQSFLKAAAALGRRDLKVKGQVCGGQPHVEIVRRARAAAADLLVLGRHGSRPVRDMFIGSTAERVIRTGNLPVLVVGRRATGGYRRPVVAVDLEDTCRAVLELALRALGPEAKSATLIHAYHVPFEGFMEPGVSPGELTDLRKEYRRATASSLAALQASLGDAGMRWQTAIVRGDPRTAILVEAARRRCDLLTVGTHGRSGLAHALIGSVAEWLIRAAPCDVLVARPARVSFELP